MSLFHYLVRDVVNALGYEIRRVPRVEEVLSRDRARLDPITGQYLRAPIVQDVSLEDARGLACAGLPLRGDIHPFVRAAQAARLAAPGTAATDAVRDVLARYYHAVRPATALEALDLTEDEAPGLAGAPPTGWIFPWADRSTAGATRRRQTAMRLDALQYGRLMPQDQGITAFGPAGATKLALEVQRVTALVRSYQADGFQPFNRKNPLLVVALRADDGYRWLVQAGQHRFALCRAFGIDTVPALVRAVVRRDDHLHWPQVVSGVFRPEGALRLFDRLFHGAPARAWVGWAEGAPGTVPDAAPGPAPARRGDRASAGALAEGDFA